jgi:hypothetical protein
MVRWISSSLARLYRPSSEEDHVGEDSPFFVFIETISLGDPMDESWEGRTLSSNATPVFKFVLPALIIGSLVAFVIAFAPAGGAGNHLLFVIAGAFAGFLLHEYLLPLKRVIATAHGLSISNYRTTIAVPFTEIVTAHAYKRWGIVEVIFRGQTQFGRSVRFVAEMRSFSLSEHPVVEFLRRRVGFGTGV